MSMLMVSIKKLIYKLQRHQTSVNNSKIGIFSAVQIHLFARKTSRKPVNVR